MSCVRLIITGRVQGVGYRAAFARKAAELELDGWVRNRRDGTVEALVAGDADAVRQIIDWSWQGPRMARVTAVAVTAENATIVANGFDIAADA